MSGTKGWGAYCHRNERLQKGATMNCEMCGSPIKEVPAGISRKTGKPYNAFKVCSNNECGFKPFEADGTKNVVVNSISTNPKPASNGTSTEMMRLAYRKDLMCSIVNTFAPLGVLHTAMPDIFNILWKTVEDK